MTWRVRGLLLVLVVSVGLLSPALASTAEAAARPVVTKVGTGAGPLRPTTVVIRGKNLRNVLAVRFGGRQGVVVHQLGANGVKVRTPRGARPGTVSVRVKTPAGWSAPSRRARYTFVEAPLLRRISPASGYFSGGQRVTLTGKHLETATKVVFGTQAARILTRRAGSLVVRTPVGVLGKVHVAVTTAGGSSRGAGITFTYTKPPQQASLVLAAAPGTMVATAVDWVTGGYDEDTGAADPWLVGLPQGAAVPTVGQDFLIRPGNAAFPSGLAGTVSEVADQLDQTVRVTVKPSDLENVVNTLKLDYSGPVVDPDSGAAVRTAEVGRAAEFSLRGPTALFCKDHDGQSVSFGADLTMTVTDVDVSQHIDLGGVVRRPSYDGAFTAELQTTGKITVAAAATCKIKEAWQNAHRRVIPLGTSGATLSFGPSFEFKVSGKGTWSVVDRTRTTFAVNADLGKAPRYSRTSRSLESKQSGELSFEAEVTGGVSMQLGLLDRAGLQGKVLLGVSVALNATGGNVCVEGELFGKITIGVFLDVWITRWEADAFSARLSIRKIDQCLLADDPAPQGEPEITSARLPDATIGIVYDATLATEDGRPGAWSVVRDPLPAGLHLDSADGKISGTPQGPVGDSTVIVNFIDQTGRVATTTIRIMIQPGQALGGGDIQATLRWSGPADLDLHVIDPAGEEIYYNHVDSASGGHLDHDANANCNGIADDDNPVENVFWPTGEAPAGTYTIWVKVFATCDAPLDWHLSARRNGSIVVDETGNGDSSTYSFTLGGAAQAAQGRGDQVRIGPHPTAPSASRYETKP
jgi:hypothetical protein